MITTSDADGDGPEDVFSLDIQGVSEEDFNHLKEMVESVNQICVGDNSIEAAVYETAKEKLDSSADIQELVDEICKKAAIYLAE